MLALGKLHLQGAAQVVSAFPTRQVEELFAYLLLYPDVTHSREKLIELLWPYQGGAMRGRFSTVLWRLRSTLAPLGEGVLAGLQVSRDTVSFRYTSSQLVVDFVRFEEQLAASQRQPEVAESLLRQAIELYRGDLYEGIYADWCLLERERLSRLYLRGLGQLMASLMQRQQFEEAVVVGQRILQRDGLREEVHRAIMYCYAQLGDYAAAASQFQQCGQLLQEELHVLPMPETIRLYQQIVEDRVKQTLPAAAASHHEQIRQALVMFQNAAAHLNQLLDRGE